MSTTKPSTVAGLHLDDGRFGVVTVDVCHYDDPAQPLIMNITTGRMSVHVTPRASNCRALAAALLAAADWADAETARAMVTA